MHITVKRKGTNIILCTGDEVKVELTLSYYTALALAKRLQQAAPELLRAEAQRERELKGNG